MTAKLDRKKEWEATAANGRFTFDATSTWRNGGNNLADNAVPSRWDVVCHFGTVQWENEANKNE